MDEQDRIEEGGILVAEGDENLRETLNVTFEREAYKIIPASSGREALRMVFAEEAPDIRLIISDVDMPDGSGVELVRVLVSYARLAKLPVIVLSRDTQSAALQLSVSAWLVKPFEIEALVALVRTHISPNPIR